MNLHNFPYFEPTKRSANFFYNFQRHSLLHIYINAIFGFWALLGRIIDEIKNSKRKIILKLPHPSFAPDHRIFNFWGALYSTYIMVMVSLIRTIIYFKFCLLMPVTTGISCVGYLKETLGMDNSLLIHTKSIF